MFINATYLGRFCTACIKLTTILAVIALFRIEFSHAQTALAGARTPNSTASSLFEQAKSYHDGVGVEANFAKAIELYQKSAALGNTDAKLNLGYIYFTGQGVAQNYDKARGYYLQAAKTGDSAAQENLGLIYEHGLGVPANMKTAKAWYDKSKSIFTPPKTTPKKPIAPLSKIPAQAIIHVQNITAKTFEPINMPAQLLGKSPSETTDKNTARINALTESITGKTANATQAKVLTPFERLKPEKYDVIQLPHWASPVIIISLLLLAMLSAIWFMWQIRTIQYRNARYKFTSLFFENHRESLRGSFLRTPHSHRRHNIPNQPWAVSLCALMVRFATIRQADPDVNCPISRRVVKRLNNTPYAAREEVFGFIPMVQDRLYFDIGSLNEEKLSPPKPYQFGHSKFFINKARKNKLNT